MVDKNFTNRLSISYLTERDDSGKIKSIKKMVEPQVSFSCQTIEAKSGKGTTIFSTTASHTMNCDIKNLEELTADEFIRLLNEQEDLTRHEKSKVEKLNQEKQSLFSCLEEHSLSNLENINPSLYKEYKINHDYCKSCDSWVETKEREEEVYSESAKDYVLRHYKVCPLCHELIK